MAGQQKIERVVRRGRGAAVLVIGGDDVAAHVRRLAASSTDGPAWPVVHAEPAAVGAWLRPGNPVVVVCEVVAPDAVERLAEVVAAGATWVLATGAEFGDDLRDLVLSAGAVEACPLRDLTTARFGLVLRAAVRAQESAREEARTRQLLSLARALLRVGTTTAVADLGARVALQGLGADAAVVARWSGDGRLQVVSATGEHAPLQPGDHLDLEAAPSAVDIAVETSSPVVTDLRLPPLPGVPHDFGMVVRLGAHPDAWGVLAVWGERLADPGSRDRDYVQQIRAILSEALGRREAEEALHRSRAQVELQATALASTAEAVFITDREGRIEWANDAVEQLSGHAPDSLVGRTPRVFQSGLTAAETYERMWRTILRGGVWRGRLLNRHRDGHVYAVEQTVTPVREHGDVRHFVAIHRDLTQWEQAQSALVESEAGLRLMTDQVPGLLVTVDRDKLVTSVQGAALPRVGGDATDLVGRSLSVLADGDGPGAELLELHLRALAGTPAEAKLELRDRTWRVLSRPMLDAQGVTTQTLLLLLDITEVLQAAREVEVHRQRLESLFRAASEAIVVTDGDGRIEQVNPAATRLTGLEDDALVGTSIHALLPVVEDPGPGSRTREGECVVHHAAGHAVEVEFSCVREVEPGVDLWVLRDVSERNTATRHAHEQERQFRDLAEQASDIVALCRVHDDSRLEVDYVNPAFQRTTGHARSRVYEDPELLRHLIGEGELQESMQRVPRSGVEHDAAVTIPLRRADGEEIWLDVRMSVVDTTTTPMTLLIVARDVTAATRERAALRAALEDQQDAARQLQLLVTMKDTFLQSMSHELRTPLTSVLGYADLLARRGAELPTETLGDVTDRLHRNAQRLHALLDDILDVRRIARPAGSPAIGEREEVDLAEVAHQAVDRVDLEERTIEVDVERLLAVVDAPGFGHVVERLLHNVRRHTPPGTHCRVRLRREGEQARLTVEDDGPGIAEVDRRRVFAPFEQGPRALHEAQPGLGLGLTLVRGYAMLHGGKALLGESLLGGAAVEVLLPLSGAVDRDAGAGAGRRVPVDAAGTDVADLDAVVAGPVGHAEDRGAHQVGGDLR